MIEFQVSADEEKLLQDHRHNGSAKLIRLKSEAVLLAAKGVGVDIIASFVQRQESTVDTWLREWRSCRMASIYCGHLGNTNASKLTDEQRAQLEDVLQQPPSTQGIPYEFWTVPDLAEWMDSEFGVTHQSRTSYHLYMRHSGLTWRKPEAYDQHRADGATIEARMRDIDNQLAEAYADGNHLIFAADEVRIEHEALL